MRLAACLLVAATVAWRPAAAADDASLADAAAASLKAAIAEAETAAAQRWAFTMTYIDRSGDETKTYVARFDPSLPEDARWTPIDPAEDALTKKERKALKTLRKNVEADDGLVYEGLADAAAAVAYARRDETGDVFVGPVSGEDVPKRIGEALQLTLRLLPDAEKPTVSLIEIDAVESFKPAAIAKVNRLAQRQFFERVSPDWPPLLVRSLSETEGKAMFKSFKSDVEFRYSAFEPVDGPPFANDAENE